MENNTDTEMIEIMRGDDIVEVHPQDLTTAELCTLLDRIEIASESSWMPETEKKEGYAAIMEAERRLIDEESIRRHSNPTLDAENICNIVIGHASNPSSQRRSLLAALNLFYSKGHSDGYKEAMDDAKNGKDKRVVAHLN